MTARTHHSWIRSLTLAVVMAATALVAPEALAGEVKFGAEPLETDDKGNLTSTGRSAATKELKSLPGEEIWPLHLWAKIDKGAPGPLYVEFYGTIPGSEKRYRAWAYEHGGYEGEKFVSLSMELDGNVGFNKGRTYTVEVVQLNEKGKNLKLASSKITLAYVEAEAQPEGDAEDDEDEEISEQDELDSFGDGDEEGDAEGPPPVEPASSKKGCHIDPGTGAAPGVLVLLMLGAGLTRRRRP
ncbi:MAG: MYXO-CTERM sorting domain-containing protein [Myxococcota bacterium]